MSRLLEIVLDDLSAESAQLERCVRGLTDDQWSVVTTPEGWTVKHQIGHLHATDLVAMAAMHDPGAFDRSLAEVAVDQQGTVDAMIERVFDVPPHVLVERWTVGRVALETALRQTDSTTRIRWYGPAMSPVSMATARLMETWAHGFDIAVAVDQEFPETGRERHVCHLGVSTFGYVFSLRGEAVPTEPVRVELTAFDASLLQWGPEDAVNRVTGRAQDFALLACRRRHRDDVDVRAEGPVADRWLDIVQTFAGSPGNDPLPLDKSVGGRER